MPRRLPAVYDPVNAKLYGEDPIRGLIEVQGTGGGGGNVNIDATIGDVFGSVGQLISGVSAGEDKIVFWDQSLGKVTYLAIGGGLTVNNNSIEADVQGNINITLSSNIADIINVSSSGYNLSFSADTAPGDRIVFYDHSAAKLTYLDVGGALSINGTTLSVVTDLVTDTSPQLGANLDTNNHRFVTTSNNNIVFDPNGSGTVKFLGNSTRGGAEIQLNCELNTHGVVIKSPPHSAGASYTLTLPPNAGTNGYVLSTNGSGTTSWIPSVTIGSNATDVLSVSNGAISGVSTGSDGILFFDSSTSKLDHLTAGVGIEIEGTTLQAGPITETSSTIDFNYTLSSGKNGFSVGPIEIANTYTVTIPQNSLWLVG